jgi:hypothetical protein
MKNTTVLSEDYVKVINKYNNKDSFFFLDPPYENSSGFGYAEEEDFNFERLANEVSKIKGHWLMTMNDSPRIRTLFKRFHITPVIIKGHKTKNGEGAVAIGGVDRKELLISNYPLPKGWQQHVGSRLKPARGGMVGGCWGFRCPLPWGSARVGVAPVAVDTDPVSEATPEVEAGRNRMVAELRRELLAAPTRDWQDVYERFMADVFANTKRILEEAREASRETSPDEYLRVVNEYQDYRQALDNFAYGWGIVPVTNPVEDAPPDTAVDVGEAKDPEGGGKSRRRGKKTPPTPTTPPGLAKVLRQTKKLLDNRR